MFIFQRERHETNVFGGREEVPRGAPQNFDAGAAVRKGMNRVKDSALSTGIIRTSVTRWTFC